MSQTVGSLSTGQGMSAAATSPTTVTARRNGLQRPAAVATALTNRPADLPRRCRDHGGCSDQQNRGLRCAPPSNAVGLCRTLCGPHLTQRVVSAACLLSVRVAAVSMQAHLLACAARSSAVVSVVRCAACSRGASVDRRPFGCGIMLAVWDIDGPALYAVEPNGSGYKYYGCALGKARQQAKTSIEVRRLARAAASVAPGHLGGVGLGGRGTHGRDCCAAGVHTRERADLPRSRHRDREDPEPMPRSVTLWPAGRTRSLLSPACPTAQI